MRAAGGVRPAPLRWPAHPTTPVRRFAVALLLLSGCATEPPAEAPPPPAVADDVPLELSEVPSFDLTGRGGGGTGAALDPGDPEAMERRMQDVMAAVERGVDLNARLGDAADWREAEAIADRALPGVPETMRPSVRLDALERILRMILAQPDLDLDDLDALGEYTNAVVVLRSTEGDDVLRALIRLEGHWDDAARADVARRAARPLGEAFANQAECVGCTVEEALEDALPQRRQSLDPLLYEIQTVHRELMRIARVGSGRS